MPVNTNKIIKQLPKARRKKIKKRAEHLIKEEMNKPTLPKNWTELTRASGLIEWVCPHAVGHPAPSSLQPTGVVVQAGWGKHGCDGCCHQYSLS